MFYVRKPKQKPIVVIRAATSGELFRYENRKIINLKEDARENKIEASICLDGSNVKPSDAKEDI